jgi:hypothetical protein
MGRTACTEPQCLYKGALYLFYLKLYFVITFQIYYSNWVKFGVGDVNVMLLIRPHYGPWVVSARNRNGGVKTAGS